MTTSQATLPTIRLLRERAAAEPDRVALIDAAGTVSYAQLDSLATLLARSLESAGMRGRPVALTARRHRDFLVELLGCMAAGAVPALIDGEWPAPRRRAAAALVMAAGEVGFGGQAPGPRQEPRGELPPELAGLLRRASHILFTSGTTGSPVATIIGTAAAERALERQCALGGLAAQDRVAFLSGPAHDPALRDLLTPLRRGAAACIPPPGVAGDPVRLAAWLAVTQVTVMHVTPLLLRLITEVPGALLPALRLVVSGGARLESGLARQVTALAPAARLVNGYGCTETPQLVTAQEVERIPEDCASVPIGAPLPGCRVEVRSEAGGIAATGDRGEIWVASPAIALGYWPPGARPGFVVDEAGLRWFRTADLARRDSAGVLSFDGRLDRQVSVHGARVELDEIEAVARTQPGATEALAEFTRDGDAGRIELWVQSPGDELTARRVRAHLAARLPAYAVPARITVVDQLGWTTRMKPARPAASNPAARPGGLSRDAMAALIRDQAEQLLGTEISEQRNFLDAGFSSLSLLELAAALEESLGRPVPPLTLFRYPNLTELAGHLHRLMRAGPAPSAEPPDTPGERA